jgi:hypothetical protein
MSNVPVVCDNCGGLFSTRSIINAPGATFSDVTFGPCPYCGGDGHVPDGTYSFVGDVTRLLQAPQRTVDELRRLAHILENAQERGADTEEIKAEIERETPEFASLTDLLPRNRAELYAFIALILMIIQMLQSTPGNIPDINIDPDIVVNATIQQQSRPPMSQPHTERHTHENSPRRVAKVGRNDVCPCGSGKKYKYCHGYPNR